jgi:hypothetical protein
MEQQGLAATVMDYSGAFMNRVSTGCFTVRPVSVVYTPDTGRTSGV